MKQISFVIFSILVSSVYSSEEKFDEDKNHFHAFLKEVSGTDYQMENFIDLMWPQVQQSIPDAVELPGIEVFDAISDFYMCAKPTIIHARIGEILDKKLLIKIQDKTTYEIEANLLLEKPVELSLSKPVEIGTATDATPSPLVHVSYLFKEPSKIKIILEIRNVFNGQEVLPPRCVMRIKAMRVDDVSEPETVSKLEDAPSKRVENHFRSTFKTEASKMLSTVGIVKAVNENLNENANFWVCSSRALDHLAGVFQKKWEYTENYNKFCLQEKKFLVDV